jgi:hypothetical protein
MLLPTIGSHHLLYARPGDEAIELVFNDFTLLCAAETTLQHRSGTV